MTPERWSQVEGLFLQAAEIPPTERATFLDHACGGDAGLRHEVNSLLAWDAPETPLARLFLDDDPGAGRQIGPYRLVRLLGTGGMGSVHLAVRDDDHFEKEVAIKILKRGMDTDSMLGRFRQERQILANLEHPFIARLLDGGSTDDGLPYFVMEYVDGLPVTKYREERNLDTGQTLQLFRMVCEAVQYAHQNLVVHRDLKPGNILITQEGVPKLLDFGIAKVIAPGRRGALETITQTEGRLMTPAYASPEQILGLPINTATDIYALGAVLYELLTGQRAHRFESELPGEMERVISQVEPEKPSLAIRAKPKQSRELVGDLDNIILTALRKDPQRRYTSAAEFSDDIRRHLEGHPVTAREDTFFYRTGKFVRRNKLAVTAGLLVAASLIGGMTAAMYQAGRAERRFQLVRQLANTVLDLQDQVRRLPGSTQVQLSMVQTVVQYLDALVPDSGGDPTLDYEIAEAYYRIAGVEGHPTQPNLGQTSLSLEHSSKALAIFERLAKLPQTREKSIPLLIDAHVQVSGIVGILGNPQAARSHTEAAEAIAAEASSAGLELPAWTLVNLYSQLAGAASQSGNVDAEQAYDRKAVEAAERWTANDRVPSVLDSLRSAYLNLADAHSHGGDFEGAKVNFEKALQVSEKLAKQPDASYTQRFALASIHHLYGDVLGATDDPNLGDPEGALAHYRKAAEINEVIAAADPKDVNARRNLTGSYRRIGMMLIEKDPGEALKFYRKAVEMSEEISAADPENIQHRSALADSLIGQGDALHHLGRNQEALQYLTRTNDLEASIESIDPNRIWYLRRMSRSLMFTGDTLLALGDKKGALDSYRKGLAAAERILQRAPTSLPHNLDRADLLEAIGRYYMNTGSKKHASPWLEQSLTIWRDWTKRNVAASYAGRCERRIQTLLDQ